MIGLGLGSALVVAGVVVRAEYADAWWWLVYNLVLAWIPVVLGRWTAGTSRAWWLLAVPWLLFLPNAPYLLTDLVHLRSRPPVPLWFDVALLGGAGALGLALGAHSLREVAEAVGRRFGRRAMWSVWGLVPLLSGFAIQLGRVQRFDSWSVVVAPGRMVSELAPLVVHPSQHLEVWALSATFGAAFFAAAAHTPPRLAPR